MIVIHLIDGKFVQDTGSGLWVVNSRLELVGMTGTIGNIKNSGADLGVDD